MADTFGDFLPWVKSLAGKHGVYVIMLKGQGRRVLYVGESHTGRLRKTFTRHFQKWTGPTSGRTYSRSGILVDVVVVARASDAPVLQNQLIDSLNPRDNRR